MDFKGPFHCREGRCHPLSILDDTSRYALGLFELKGLRMGPAQGCVPKRVGRVGGVIR